MMRTAAFTMLLAGGLPSCGAHAPDPPASSPPSVLWIVWDTVRADHLSLYGYAKETTPFLDRWARAARVWEDCLTPGVATVPAHASMFTGLAVSEHGSHNGNTSLALELDTLAELLAGGGYRTYAWSANPHISGSSGFTQGFQREQHPWDDAFIERARAVVAAKFTDDERERFESRMERENKIEWALKASGTLAREALSDWLESTDPDRPYFAFLNYMEAHRDLLPARAYRQRFLSPEQVERSYEIDASWKQTWSYTFGLAEYPAQDLEIMTGVYDAALAELDDLLADLLTNLEAAGQLENTVVIVTADHGEHLGEHHLLEHQFSLYQGLVRVPLVVHYPPAFAAGRDSAPVMNFDLFPTLLELAGLAQGAPAAYSRSLLSSATERARLSEYPVPFQSAFRAVRELHADFDPQPWGSLWAWIEPPWKLIWRPTGPAELYDLASDPDERTNLAADKAKRVERMAQALLEARGRALPRGDARGSAVPLSARERKVLSSLGYLDSGADDADDDQRQRR